MKLQTVNVIEIANGNFQNIRSFTDDAEGNKEAEELFGKLIRENSAVPPSDLPPDAIEDVIDMAKDDGIWTDGAGYEVLLTHAVH